MTIPKIFTFAERHDDETSFRFIFNHIGYFKNALYDLEEAWDHARAMEVLDDLGYQNDVIKDNLNILRSRDVNETDCANKENVNALREARETVLKSLSEFYTDALREMMRMTEDEDWEEKFDLDFEWVAEELEEEESKN